MMRRVLNLAVLLWLVALTYTQLQDINKAVYSLPPVPHIPVPKFLRPKPKPLDPDQSPDMKCFDFGAGCDDNGLHLYI